MKRMTRRTRRPRFCRGRCRTCRSAATVPTTTSSRPRLRRPPRVAVVAAWACAYVVHGTLPRRTRAGAPTHSVVGWPVCARVSAGTGRPPTARWHCRGGPPHRRAASCGGCQGQGRGRGRGAGGGIERRHVRRRLAYLLLTLLRHEDNRSLLLSFSLFFSPPSRRCALLTRPLGMLAARSHVSPSSLLLLIVPHV